MSTLKKGDKAPDFSLHSTNKDVVTLSDQKGKNVVLLFFPLAFTGVCTTEMCTVRDSMAFYNTADAEVFGISIDPVPSLIKFKEDQNLQFTLLSDSNREAVRAYDAVYEDFAFGLKGVAKRSAFVIDKDGIIQYAKVLDNAGELPNFDAIQETLKSLS